MHSPCVRAERLGDQRFEVMAVGDRSDSEKAIQGRVDGRTTLLARPTTDLGEPTVTSRGVALG